MSRIQARRALVAGLCELCAHNSQNAHIGTNWPSTVQDELHWVGEHVLRLMAMTGASVAGWGDGLWMAGVSAAQGGKGWEVDDAALDTATTWLCLFTQWLRHKHAETVPQHCSQRVWKECCRLLCTLAYSARAGSGRCL